MTGTDPGPKAGPPRVLIEHSEYWLSNMGDLAMMDVTLRRLREHWADTRIGVLTDSPALMRAYFPGIDPVDPRGSSVWSPPGLIAKLAQHAGPRLVAPVAIGWLTARALVPQKLAGARRRGRRLVSRSVLGRLAPQARVVEAEKAEMSPPPPRRASPNTLRAAETSALVLAMGGGYLTDQDYAQSTRVLSLLEHAHSVGVPTAMVGQGLGPIDEPALLARASEVLPTAGFLAVRERRKGPALLQNLGVDPSRVEVTGDDAIELPYEMRRSDLGTDLGVCLRVAGYSPVSEHAKQEVASTLQTLGRELDAALVPVVIAEYRRQDRRSTLPLLRGASRTRRPLPPYSRPQDVAAQVGGCRVMVTGAYHAGVFALSQGIPVVALTSSVYYDDKFLGLADMFGGGLELLHLDSDRLGPRLASAVRDAWAGAEEGRAALLASAAEQIAASRRGFERAFSLA